MNGEASGSAKKHQAITLEAKIDVMRFEKGEKMADVAQKFNTTTDEPESDVDENT